MTDRLQRLVYKPNPDAFGASLDTIAYRAFACFPHSLPSLAKPIRFRVDEVNDVPFIANYTALNITIDENSPTLINLNSTWVDPDLRHAPSWSTWRLTIASEDVLVLIDSPPARGVLYQMENGSKAEKMCALFLFLPLFSSHGSPSSNTQLTSYAVLYEPPSDQCDLAFAEFHYTVTDGKATSAPARVLINVMCTPGSSCVGSTCRSFL